MLKLRKCITYFINYNNRRQKSYTSGDYCLNLVRSMDNENFMCTLLLPSKLRATALAIRAFNSEVASVQDQVSQPKIGLMRMKFWEDCIEKIYGGNKIPNNPVAVELAKAVKRHKLSKLYLLKLVNSRTSHLDQPSFMSLREMELYADDTCSVIFLLLLEASNAKSNELNEIALSLGKAQGLTNLLRSVPHNSSKRLLNLPSDLLAHYDLTEEGVFRRSNCDALNQVVRRVAENAFLHLKKARELKASVPLSVRPVFLPAVSTGYYLSSLRKCGFDVFDPRMSGKRPLLPISLYCYSLLRSF